MGFEPGTFEFLYLPTYLSINFRTCLNQLRYRLRLYAKVLILHIVRGKMVPGKMVPGKMVLWKNGPWEKWSSGKMVLGKYSSKIVLRQRSANKFKRPFCFSRLITLHTQKDV